MSNLFSQENRSRRSRLSSLKHGYLVIERPVKLHSASNVILGSYQVLLLSEHGIVIFRKVKSVGQIVLFIVLASAS